jgi:glycyl-tRNA synthetase beta chain
MPDLLVEIGCEELPALACRDAEQQLEEFLPLMLVNDYGIVTDRGDVKVYVTPRRLAVCVADLGSELPPKPSSIKGPRVDSGDMALVGFARKHHIEVADLEHRGGFVWANRVGEPTPMTDVIKALVPDMVGRLKFDRVMRWPGGRFSRPIRWLVVKFGEDVVEVSVMGVISGAESHGHRTAGGEVRIGSASSYLEDVRGVRVVADAAERRELIELGLNQAGEWIDPMGKMDEVVYLVEWPVVMEGRFDQRYLELPERVAITAMQSHQRYFPLVRDGGLEPRFAFVANGGDPAVVVAGNEEVLVGRLEDAAFAFGKDLERGLEAMLAELGRVSFMEGGGSLAEKSERVQEVAGQLCDRVEADAETRDAVLRAARLCKADIVSGLVAEFSDLQGYAGSLYAARSGEPPAVCEAIDQHHRPVEAGGPLPTNEAGALLAIADKTDTVAVALALGAQPTGSRDPYGLRRAAAGIVAIALERGFELGLGELMAASVHGLVAQGYDLKRKPLEAVPDAVGFVLDRVEPAMLEEGVTVEEIRAARGSGVTGPLPLAALCRALRDARGSESLAALRDAYGRCVRIASKAAEEAAAAVDTSLFEMDEERGLCAALTVADIEIADAAARRDFTAALDAAAAMVAPINGYFEAVMVMADDPVIRANRLKLLADVASTLRLVGDFEQLPG